MGNNAAFTYFEATTLATYDKGVLDRDLLSSFMELHRGEDIDSGGREGNLSIDGKDIVEVVLTVFGVKIPERPVLPKDHNTWTREQDDANEAWDQALWDAFTTITNKFGWE